MFQNVLKCKFPYDAYKFFQLMVIIMKVVLDILMNVNKYHKGYDSNKQRVKTFFKIHKVYASRAPRKAGM